MLFFQDGMVGDKAFFTTGTILGGDKNTSDTLKILTFEQVFRRSCPQQERGFTSHLAETITHIKQWCHPYATSNEQGVLLRT